MNPAIDPHAPSWSTIYQSAMTKQQTTSWPYPLIRPLLHAGLHAIIVGIGCNYQLPCPAPEPNTTILVPPSASGPVYVGDGDPYQRGNLPVTRIELDRCERNIPAAAIIHAPEPAGPYPTIVFQHGFLLANRYYDSFLSYIASHGFIVVAPQMYPADGCPLFKPSTTDEANLGREIIAWLPGHLNDRVDGKANTDILGLAGHSRGGRVAWLMCNQEPDKYAGWVGIDPVDSPMGPFQLEPPVTSTPLEYDAPTLIIGAGLAGYSPGYPGLSCAPVGSNHTQFYAASPSPAWHIVLPDGGHLDILDDQLASSLIAALCTISEQPQIGRRVTAGLMVAFFRATLQGQNDALEYLSSPENAPLKFEMESR